MPSASSSRSAKPKPAEVAAETKKFLKKCAGTWPARAYLYAQPLAICPTQFPARPMMSLAPPVFCEFSPNPCPSPWNSSCVTPALFLGILCTVARHRSTNTFGCCLGVRDGDPVDFATCWSSANNNTKVAFICAANEKRPGGDWETGVVGYEESLCRRSNLSSHLSNPKETNYPIPSEGGLYSDRVGKSVSCIRGVHLRRRLRLTTSLSTSKQSSSAAPTTATSTVTPQTGASCPSSPSFPHAGPSSRPTAPVTRSSKSATSPRKSCESPSPSACTRTFAASSLVTLASAPTATRLRPWPRCGARSSCGTQTCAAASRTSLLCLRTAARAPFTSSWTMWLKKAGAPGAATRLLLRRGAARARTRCRVRRAGAQVGIPQTTTSLRRSSVLRKSRGY